MWIFELAIAALNPEPVLKLNRIQWFLGHKAPFLC
jgi:hypothetical protein